jgi:hypothetical protein
MLETTGHEDVWSEEMQRTRADKSRLEHLDIKIRPPFGCSRTWGPVSEAKEGSFGPGEFSCGS